MANIFNGINPSNKAKIIQYLEALTLTCQSSTDVMSKIKLSNNVAFVLSGYLQIIRTDYNGNKIVIEDLEEGDVFGSIISSINSNEYTVIAKEDSKVLVFDYDHIINNNLNFKAYNIFLKNLLQIINTKFEKNNERLIILTNKSIRDKLLEYFRLMHAKNKSKIIYLPFSYIALADYLAVDRCSLSREIKHLKEDGLIEVDGKKIKLLY